MQSQLCQCASSRNVAACLTTPKPAAQPRQGGVTGRVSRGPDCCPRSSSIGGRPARLTTVHVAAKGFGNGPAKKADSKPKKAKTAVIRELCPCSSGRKYEECCEVYHRGAVPPTIEATLRARFAAFAKKRKEFVLLTTHPDYHVVKYGSEPNGSIQQLILDINAACDKFEFYDFKLQDLEQVSDTEGWATFQYKQYEIAPEVQPRQDIPKWLQQQELMASQKAQKELDPFRWRVFVERSKFVKGEGGRWQFADFEMLEVPNWLSRGYASRRDAEIAYEEAQAQLRAQEAQQGQQQAGAAA